MRYGKWESNGYRLAGNIKGNILVPEGRVKTLNFTNVNNPKDVVKIATFPTDMYSINSKNYSGFDCIIDSINIEKLVAGETYEVSLEFYYGIQVWNLPIYDTVKSATLGSKFGFTIEEKDTILGIIKQA